MTTDYHIQANTRKCALTGRELKPGEKVYSVLFDEAGKFIRRDYSSEAWSGPPPQAFSFWVGRVSRDEDKRPRLDDELLMESFQRLEGQTDPGRVNFRYVLALLLLRRKRLKFEGVRTEGDRETLSLRCVRTRNLYQVINPRLPEDELAAVQEEVFQVLGWD